MQKRKITTEIKSLKGGHDSLLNKSYYSYECLDLNSLENMKTLDGSFENNNIFYDLDLALEQEIKKVSSYLKRLNVPHVFENRLNYEFIVNYQTGEVTINGEEYNTSINPKDKDKNGLLKGKSDLTIILQSFFSHIPAIQQIGNFYFLVDQLKLYRKNNNIDMAVLCAIRAIQNTRAIVIAELESEYLAEIARKKPTASSDRFILDRYFELEGEGVSKEAAANIIFLEIQENTSLKNITESRIRKKLQGKNLEELKNSLRD